MRDRRIRFESDSPLYLDLKARVARYFEATGASPYGGPRMWLKTVVLSVFTWGCWTLFLLSGGHWWDVLLYGTLGALGVAGIGFCVQHDASHGAYSSRPAVNRFFARFMDLIGGSSHVWRTKHNVIHHTYPNLVDVDQDLDSGGLARFAPGQPWRAAQRYQHLYIWPLYALLGVKWMWFDDLFNVARGVIGTHPLPRPRGAEWFVLLGGKLLAITWTFVIPWFVHGFWIALAFHVYAQTVAGLTMAVVFQCAHCVQEADFPAVPTPPDGETEWAVHQLNTAVDFGRGQSFLTWYVGGLNYQAVHHLFPRVCHIHYPAISEIVEATCRDHGVRYRTNPTFWSAVRSHVAWLRRLGSSAVIPAE